MPFDHTAYMREYRKRPGKMKKHRESVARHRKKYPERVRDARIRHVFGISAKEHDARRRKQKGLCALCGRKRRLVLDHCHKTKKVRAFLCHGCNVSIGMLQENTSLMKKAIKYLEKKW